MHLNRMGVALCLLLAALTPAASALDFDFEGNFQVDNEVHFFQFTVGDTSDVTVFSSSWDDGGFDPILSIWSNMGELLAYQDDGGVVGSTQSNGVWYDHGVWDSYYSVNLSAGTYYASVGMYDNFPVGSNWADGFWWDGVPQFSYQQGYGPAPYFNGVDGTCDTGHYVFHITGVDDAQIIDPPGPVVPEPASMTLLGLGLGGFVLRRFKKA